METHQKRVITAAAVLTLPIIAIIMQGYVLLVVLAIFCGAGLWEYYGLFWSGDKFRRTKIGGLICAALLLAALSQTDGRLALAALLALFWAVNIYYLKKYASNPEETSYSDCLILFSGLMYIPFSLHFTLHFQRAEIILVLLAASVSDTAAYYAGSWLGKKKVWPVISPNKTIAGSVGGFMACVLCTLILGLSLGDSPWWSWIILGAVLNMAAQLGDFFESALKRKLSVKDTGSILPGHGGVLDRMDSLLFVVPVFGLAKMFHPFF